MSGGLRRLGTTSEGGQDAVLQEDLLVKGADFGGVSDGMLFESGTAFEEIFRAQMIEAIPPNYIGPTLGLAGSGSLDVEAGSLISPTLTGTFNPNDAGAGTAYRLNKNGALLSADNPYNHAQITIGDENIDFVAQMDYAQGAIKNDNLGNPYPSGHIAASTAISNLVRYRGLRNLFYDVSKPGTTSAEIRALANKILNPLPGYGFTLNIPAGATSVIFAYLATLPVPSSIKYVEGLNAEVKEIFTETNVPVEGANAFLANAYRVFIYTPAAPFSQAATYNIYL